MALRVKLRIKVANSEAKAEVSALVNTGFETEKPQLLIPKALASKLGLWPPPPDSKLIELGTAGGPVRHFLLPGFLEVAVVAGEREVGPVACDAIISHIEEEVIVNDKLSEALGIIIVGPGSGKWRFVDDPPDLIRRSEEPQFF